MKVIKAIVKYLICSIAALIIAYMGIHSIGFEMMVIFILVSIYFRNQTYKS